MKKWLPGLVDLQMNGFAGVDFNRETLTERDVIHVCRRLREHDVVAFLPTLITNDPERTANLAETIFRALPVEGAKILGIHLEGPFLSPKPGACGAHPLKWIRPPDLDWVKRLQDRCQGMIRLLTLSPEWPGSIELIEKLVHEMGIRVAIGHTMAAPEHITEAVNAGATLSTHLGNGIPAFLARHPNPIWSQLAEPKLWASVIGDGFHLSREVFEVFQKVKENNLFLVSDSTEFAGMPPGKYHAHIGGDVVLRPDGKLHLANDATLLAGSAMSMKQIIEKIVRHDWLTFEQAWELGSTRPWTYLGETCELEKVERVTDL